MAHTPRHAICSLLLPVAGVLCCCLLSGCGIFNFFSGGGDGDTSAQRKRIVSTAYSQMGKRYKWGGESPSQGFDCSGLIYWAYRKNGVNVPRVTWDQAKAGKSVSKGRAQPGDIVVFRTSGGSRGLHTGIYVGKNTFIHSPRKGQKVRMESMEVDYWKSKLVSVRRVLN